MSHHYQSPIKHDRVIVLHLPDIGLPRVTYILARNMIIENIQDGGWRFTLFEWFLVSEIMRRRALHQLTVCMVQSSPGKQQRVVEFSSAVRTLCLRTQHNNTIMPRTHCCSINQYNDHITR